LAGDDILNDLSEVFMDALHQFSGRWFVFKIGGELASNASHLARSVGAAVRACLDAGIQVVVVHGAGPQANEISKRFGIETKQMHGQRITDEATLEVMKMAAGQASVNVAAAFKLAGVEALCTSGVSASLVECTRRPPMAFEPSMDLVDYGLVGDITVLNLHLLEKLGSLNLVPVISCLAADAQGRVFNVNADTVAAQLAKHLNAAKLILVSNVPGVLRDRNNAQSRIARLDKALCAQLIQTGVVSGGMIPKVQECLAMLDEGIEAIHIVDTSPAEAVLDEILSPGSRGTMFVHSPKDL
jgi:acetylglutamate kinase